MSSHTSIDVLCHDASDSAFIRRLTAAGSIKSSERCQVKDDTCTGSSHFAVLAAFAPISAFVPGHSP